MRLKEERFDQALEAYERVLALDGVNQAAKKGLVTVSEARQKAKDAKKLIPLDKVPVLMLGSVALSQQQFDPQEGFLLSRINGHWDVRSILKLCPLPEEEALVILSSPLGAQGDRPALVSRSRRFGCGLREHHCARSGLISRDGLIAGRYRHSPISRRAPGAPSARCRFLANRTPGSGRRRRPLAFAPDCR